jgi:XPB/Ssl2-like helicase family protein
MPRTSVVLRVSTEEAFQSLHVDDLKPLARLLTKEVPSRKGDLAELVSRAMQDPARVRSLYEGMSELSQAAIREATHDPLGNLDPALFKAKYGQAPTVGAGKSTTALRLFFPVGRSLPSDLQQLLVAFVPQPRAAAIATCAEIPESIEQQETVWDPAARERKVVTWHEPVQVRETEREALHDLPAVLRLIDAGKIGVSATTRRPGQAALKTVASVLYGGDFYTGDEEGLDMEERDDLPIKPFAWPLIVQAAGFASLSGTKLQLTAAGRKAVSLPAHEALRAAWNKWLRTTMLDEFSRVNAIKGQGGKGKAGLTAVARRRDMIADALGECPPGEWIAVDELFRYMQAAGHSFEITRDPWSLYISDPNYGSLGYDGFHDWELLQGRYVLALLFEYAAPLGLIDVAYILPAGARRDYHLLWGIDDLSYFSRYDGLLYFRINSLGAWILDLTDRYEPKRAAAEPVLRVLPNREVAVTGPALAPGDTLFLDRFADRVSDVVWRLTEPRCLAAVEEGMSLAELQEFLRSRSGRDLPHTVEVFLDDLRRRSERLRDLGVARLLECADAELALLLVNDRRLRDLCQVAGERHLVFRAADEPAVRRALRELGYALPPAAGPV